MEWEILKGFQKTVGETLLIDQEFNNLSNETSLLSLTVKQ